MIETTVDRPRSWLRALRGWWLIPIQLVLYDVANRLSLHWIKSLSDNPGSNPPWYFIRRDAISAGCFLGALAICLVVAICARLRYPVYANMLAWMSILWFGGRVWQGIVILFSTHNLFQPVGATTRWSTFEAYLYDPVIQAGQLGVYVLTFVLVAASFRNVSRVA